MCNCVSDVRLIINIYSLESTKQELSIKHKHRFKTRI